MTRVSSPVIIATEVRAIIDAGGSVVIESLEDISKKGTATVGQWYFEIVWPDRETRKMLVFKLTREPEIIRSAVGVIAKLTSWGLPTIAFPTLKGQKIEIFNDGSCLPIRGADT